MKIAKDKTYCKSPRFCSTCQNYEIILCTHLPKALYNRNCRAIFYYIKYIIIEKLKKTIYILLRFY